MKLFNIVKKIYQLPNKNVAKIIVPIINIAASYVRKAELIITKKLEDLDIIPFEEKTIMVHGVSVGEIISLENLINNIKNNFPNTKIVLTAGTKAGLEIAQKKYTEKVSLITYFPLDIKDIVKDFIDKINPAVILIAETEIWPNFSFYAKEKNIPLFIINGRLSDKSYPMYKKISCFLKYVLNCYTGVFTQSSIDNERFLSLGLEKSKVQVMKNLKFEIEKKICDIDLRKNKSKIFIAGSTHKGEDEIAVNAYKYLREKNSNIKMIIAPRHLTRLEEVENIVKSSKFNYGFRTKNDTLENCDILILDTVGELSKVYEQCDVAYIGGSFNKTGGHNPLEATIYSKPTISGPSIKNFRDIYSILEKANASFVVKNEKEFQEKLEKLFNDDNYYIEISNNCKNCFEEQQGAVNFVINKLKEIIK